MTAIRTTTRFRVEGMDCPACATKVERAARRVDGVADVSVSVTAATMTVTHAATTDLAAVARTVTRLGYPAMPLAARATPGAGEAGLKGGGEAVSEGGGEAGSEGGGRGMPAGGTEDASPPRQPACGAGDHEHRHPARPSGTTGADHADHAGDHGPHEGSGQFASHEHHDRCEHAGTREPHDHHASPHDHARSERHTHPAPLDGAETDGGGGGAEAASVGRATGRHGHSLRHGVEGDGAEADGGGGEPASVGGAPDHRGRRHDVGGQGPEAGGHVRRGRVPAGGSDGGRADASGAAAARAAGGAAGLHGHAHEHGADGGRWWRSGKARLTMASGAAVALAMAIGTAVPAVATPAFVAALAVGLVPIGRRALLAARHGTPFSIEMLMTIAAVGAVVIGAAEEAATVVFLFLVGELLEGVAAGRARASIQALTQLVPATARVERDGTVTEVAAASLAVGDVIQVRPGDRVAADGTILDGTSAIDEAPVTGESVPAVKGAGDGVFAGTVNGDGLLKVRVTAAATDNTIARVVRLVEEAQEAKAPTERFIDRFSRWYTPGVVAVAALVAVVPPLLGYGGFEAFLYKGLAILLIGCPCALVISVPAAIAAGLSAGARRGLLMKGGAVLETAGRLTAIAFDKTGTLTAGKPAVTDVIAIRGVSDERGVLALAAALDAGSSHPLALAILARAAAEGIRAAPATEVRVLPGRGIEGRIDGMRVFLGSAAAGEAMTDFSAGERAVVAAKADEGKSVSVVLKDGRLAGAIAMRDEPRADAIRGIGALKALGLRPVMLTGDNRRTAEAVAGALGIEAHADLLPADKQRIVRTLQAEGHLVGKVGDGINDAPALAAADVGIAMGGGTDVALETADAAVLHGRVMDIANIIGLSRAVMANIRQNIAIALGLKAVFLVTTIAGITGLWPAILADTGATVLVTANAMRLLSWKGKS